MNTWFSLRRFWSTAAITFFLMLSSSFPLTGLASENGYAQGTVITPNSTRISIQIADTDEKRALGLGQRDFLKPGWGMLFIFNKKEPHGFWMKDMRFPIDIVWLDNYRIVHIESSVPAPTPGSRLPIYKPDKSANFVLELNAGEAQRLGLQMGQTLQYQW